jgi:hypothetical protein
MERNGSILGCLVISCVLFMQVGCQEQARVRDDRTGLPEEAAVRVVEEPAGPLEKPEVVLDKPKPESASASSKAAVVAQKVETKVAESIPEVTQPAPRITFENEVCDFGDVGPGTTKTCEFKFANTGNDPLEIINIEKCCGVVAKLGKRKYVPGERGTLTVQPRFGSGPGSWSRKVYVNSSDRERPRVALTIRAKIVPKVDWEPKRLKFSPRTDEATYPKITVRCLDGSPFSITGFKSMGDCITADYDPSVEATKFVLQPNVNMEKLQKGLSGVVSISLTHPDFDTASIVFDVLPKFTISPPTIVVFDATPNKPLVRKVWVLNNTGEDFEIESTSSRNNVLNVLGQAKVGKGYQLEVEVTPPAIEGDRKIFTDVLSVNLRDGEKLMVSCRGFYEGQKSPPRVPVKRGGGSALRGR